MLFVSFRAGPGQIRDFWWQFLRFSNYDTNLRRVEVAPTRKLILVKGKSNILVSVVVCLFDGGAQICNQRVNEGFPVTKYLLNWKFLFNYSTTRF